MTAKKKEPFLSDKQVLESHALYMGSDISLRDVAKRYRVSHEWLRSLWKRRGLATDKRPAQHRAALDRAWDREQEIFKSYRIHGSIPRVAEALGMDEDVIAPVLETMPHRNLYQASAPAAHTNGATLPDDHLIALRRYVRATGETTMEGYITWRRKHGGPSPSTIRKHCPWTEAVKVAVREYT